MSAKAKEANRMALAYMTLSVLVAALFTLLLLERNPYGLLHYSDEVRLSHIDNKLRQDCYSFRHAEEDQILWARILSDELKGRGSNAMPPDIHACSDEIDHFEESVAPT